MPKKSLNNKRIKILKSQNRKQEKRGFEQQQQMK